MKHNNLVEEDYITKIETIEGNTLFVITRFKSHQTNVKTLFTLGTVTVYEANRKMSYYLGENCLNTSITWDNAYFQKLRGALAEQNKDALYSFTNLDPEATNQYKYFKVAFRMPKKTEIVFINMKCTIVTTIRVIESLLDECIRINRDKIRYMEEQERRIQSTDTEKNMLVENLIVEAKSKKDLENELIDKFTLVFAEKKKKIKELEAQIERNRMNMELELTRAVLQNEEVVAPQQEENKADTAAVESLNFASLPLTLPNNIEIPSSLQASTNSQSSQREKTSDPQLSPAQKSLEKKKSITEFLS